MSGARARLTFALVALTAIASCGRETVTALDLKIRPTGAVDQIEIASVFLEGMPLTIGDRERFFPAMLAMPPRLLEDGDVVTLWFADSDAGKKVTVIVRGHRCGTALAGTVTTAEQTLTQGNTVSLSVDITAPDVPTCGASGSGGRGGAAGTAGAGGGGGGGAAGTGNAGTGGTAGAGGSVAGTGGASTGGATGLAGRGGQGGTAGGTGGGAAGTGGRGGQSGSGGSAGAGGRGGAAGSGGAAGIGGRGGSAGTGTGGTAGRGGQGGTSGTAGAGGRGGQGGTAGAGGTASCPLATIRNVQVGRMNQAAGSGPFSCGYQSLTTGSWHVATMIAQGYLIGTINNTEYAVGPQCGRCLELTRTISGAPVRTVTFTVVGECAPNDQCGPNAGRNQYMLSDTTFNQIGNQTEIVAGMDPSIDIVTARDVPCPFTQQQPIYGQMHYTAGVADGVLFTGNRYPIQAVQLQQVPANVPLTRDTGNLWRPPTGMVLSGSSWTFLITDINGRTVTTTALVTANVEQSTGVQNPVCQ